MLRVIGLKTEAVFQKRNSKLSLLVRTRFPRLTPILLVFTSSSDWFVALFTSFEALDWFNTVITCTLVLVLQHALENL